jgi:flavin-dependent dehydrogenase
MRMSAIKEYPNLWRPAVVDGMALVGDAMMSIDPLWGVGCGFAIQTAEWLADSTAALLLAGRPIGSGLRRYARAVSRRLSGHRFLINDFSRRRAFNPLERLTFSAAARNREMSRHLHAFGARLIGPARFLSPVAITRAAWVNVTYSAAAHARARVPA